MAKKIQEVVEIGDKNPATGNLIHHIKKNKIGYKTINGYVHFRIFGSVITEYKVREDIFFKYYNG